MIDWLITITHAYKSRDWHRRAKWWNIAFFDDRAFRVRELPLSEHNVRLHNQQHFHEIRVIIYFRDHQPRSVLSLLFLMWKESCSFCRTFRHTTLRPVTRRCPSLTKTADLQCIRNRFGSIQHLSRCVTQKHLKCVEFRHWRDRPTVFFSINVVVHFGPHSVLCIINCMCLSAGILCRINVYNVFIVVVQQLHLESVNTCCFFVMPSTNLITVACRSILIAMFSALNSTMCT